MPSPDTVLIIPAAGAGSRLQSAMPKVLAPVNGRPMLDHLLDRYRSSIRQFVVVLNPAFETVVREHCREVAPDLNVSFTIQADPTGMLDAILLGSDTVRAAAPARVWITWCDQVGVHPDTIARLQHLSQVEAHAPMVFPTARMEHPYIHLERDSQGQIVAIRQRREGDAMPSHGESDMGLFSLSPQGYLHWLPQFGREAASAAGTHERNFLPFVPWLVQRQQPVVTFPCTDRMEALGVNTPEDRRRMEQYLRERERA